MMLSLMIGSSVADEFKNHVFISWLETRIHGPVVLLSPIHPPSSRHSLHQGLLVHRAGAACLLNGTKPEGRKNLAPGTHVLDFCQPASLHLTQVNPNGEVYPVPQP